MVEIKVYRAEGEIMQNYSDKYNNTLNLKSVANTKNGQEAGFNATGEATSPIQGAFNRENIAVSKEQSNVIQMPINNLSYVTIIKKDGTQEEYNKKINEAKGVLLAAADAAKVGGSEVERLRAEYIAFNKVQNANKSTSGAGKLQDDAIKSIQQLKQAMTKAELDMEQSRISLMEDGGDKELAQLRLNHQKRMAEIRKVPG